MKNFGGVGHLAKGHLAAQVEVFNVAPGGDFEARVFFEVLLPQQLVGHVGLVLEPGGVEQLQVIGVNLGLEAAAQGVAAQHHGQRAAGFQVFDLKRQLRQGHVQAVVGIKRVQAGDAAGPVIGLGLDVEVKHGHVEIIAVGSDLGQGVSRSRKRQRAVSLICMIMRPRLPRALALAALAWMHY